MIFFSLATFYYFNQKAKIRREARKKKYEEKFEELMEVLKKESIDKKN
jgi:hypothetical protein